MQQNMLHAYVYNYILNNVRLNQLVNNDSDDEKVIVRGIELNAQPCHSRC